MRRAWWWGVVAFGLGLAAGAVAQQPSGPTQSGKQVSAIVGRLQSEPSLRNNHIDVTVENGVAKLTGTVDSEAEKAAAARAATVGGIVGVDNRLIVSGPSALEQTVADDALRASIREHLLGDERSRFDHVKVTCQNGVVTLAGSVPNELALKQALDIAHGTDGVRDVENNLTIAPSTGP